MTAQEISTRALATSASASGGATVATELISFLDVLRPQVHLFDMGVQFMGGMTSNFSLPKGLTDSDFNWVGENPGADNADVDPTFGQVQFSPKGATASTSWSRQLLIQSSVDVEARVRNGIVRRGAIGLEKASIQGAGGLQPKGLPTSTGVNVVIVGANGGPLTKPLLTSMDTVIQVANADLGEGMYLITPENAGYLENTPELNNTIALPIMTTGADGIGRIRGKKAYRSNLLPKTLLKGTATNCHAAAYGYWPELTIAEWGAMEILLDPYTKARQQLINIIANFLVDSNPTYPQAFSVILDSLPQ
jgi:HK97 family phage major capsid protein